MNLDLLFKLITAKGDEKVDISSVRWTVAILGILMLYIVSNQTRKRVAKGLPPILGGVF